MRSVWLQVLTLTINLIAKSNKKVFDVHALPAAEFAKSLGLPGTPRIRFIQVTPFNKFLRSHYMTEQEEGQK
jgi:ATP-dependent RNA helicase DDX10/DBP4